MTYAPQTGKMKQNDESIAMEETNSSSPDSKSSTTQNFKPPDGGWGWVVVGAAFMVHVIADGVLFTLGILYVEFLHEFKEGKGKTAWISSLCITFMLVSGPVVSIVTNRFGSRVVCIAGSLISAGGLICASFARNIYLVYVFIGAITGTGFGCILLSTLVCIGFYFDKNRSLAMGLSVGGSGVGIFAFAPLVRQLIDTYGWRGSVLIESAILLNVLVCGAFFRPLTSMTRKNSNTNNVQKSTTNINMGQIETHSRNEESFHKNVVDGKDCAKLESCETSNSSKSKRDSILTIFDFTLLVNPLFIVFTISNSVIAIVYNAPFTYLTDRAEEKGTSQFDSAMLLSVMGIANTVGRFFFGWLGDRECVSRLALFGSALCICGIANFLNPLNDSYPFLMTYSIVHGLCIGVFVSLNSVIMADLFGLEKLSNTIGLIMFFTGIFVLVGLPLTGWLYDATGDYNATFYVVGAGFIFSGIILPLIPLLQSKMKKRLYSVNQIDAGKE